MALKPRTPATAWGRAFEVAFEAAIAMVLGVVVGVYIDRRFDTEPVFLFVFLALGFATSLRLLLSIKPPGPPGSDPNGGDRSGQNHP